MPVFEYKAVTPRGVIQESRREAASASSLAEELRGAGLAVISITESTDNRIKIGKLPPKWHPSWLLPMTSLDVELGLQQLSSMLRSGVTMLQALKTIEEQAARPRASLVWKNVHETIHSGSALSDALNKHPKFFTADIVQLIRVGEFSGELDVVCLRASERLESRRNLKMMVANALIYPCIALLMALGVSGYLVAVVIPKISEFLGAGNVALPAMTQLLMNASTWLRANGLYIAVMFAASIATWFAVRLHSAGRELEDYILLKTPVIGRIFRLSGTATFAHGMGLLIESGVTLLDSLQVASQMMSNRRLGRRIDEAHERLIQGDSLAAALEQSPEFLPMLSRMVAVAETTGSLGSTFKEVALFHETILGITIKRLSVIIEPLMIFITGGIVGFVYVSFFMALFSMANIS
ncbi:MAG: type II secretion system F family protein [Lentisphaerae bacterium]|jgi:type II secretory pathway component PulF|nr:type II secretion system F family protein [Lentisphaerota bacterium]